MKTVKILCLALLVITSSCAKVEKKKKCQELYNAMVIAKSRENNAFAKLNDNPSNYYEQYLVCQEAIKARITAESDYYNNSCQNVKL